tara:strand:+ start:41 stop:541 length:501 start_codon:yes stop_codon:yes gene_type:complete
MKKLLNSITMKNLYASFILIILFSCCTSNKNNDSPKNKINQISNKDFVIINSYDNMFFDKKELNIQANEEINLILIHNGKMKKEIMGHNFVILKKNVDIDNFARKAYMSKETDYIPDTNETIAYTKLIGGGQSDTITFLIKETGKYNYICSFPGHHQLMKGILNVN